MKHNIEELDQLVVFLRGEAERLEQLAEERHYRWSEINAKKLRRVADILLQVRRDQQMTGMSGKEIGR